MGLTIISYLFFLCFIVKISVKWYNKFDNKGKGDVCVNDR
ncbi:hypothetical protein TICRE_21820 [Tissierella creatinophila DSM 6911]|uniref:Uncharacterized protein n=1 Tax=Tissierella creatinophila DSM 6911 TaxID=1123403 RepID=A0A1U7M3E4_TISCR|nr:hypothetical protein TICRE_21820 [Tissierella creatinophila DSM 6911]